jgi:cell division protein FtsI/penicillin-binding protein 2
LERLVPVRGEVFLRDRDGKLYPVATNRDTYQVYAEPRNIKEPAKIAVILAPMLVLDQTELEKKLTGSGLYTPLGRGVSEDLARQIKESLEKEGLSSGIRMNREPARLYPEEGMGGHVLGFVGADAKGERKGRYGIEGYWDKELSGTPGFIAAEKDIGGRWIPLADKKIEPAQDGVDLILTLDRAIQYYACARLKEAVSRHGAEGGSVVVLDPKTGSVLALCGAPDFDPNNFSKTENIASFNNPAIFLQYEPGSVMKPLTMAAAIDQGKLSPQSTYEDPGEMKFGPFTVKNSDGQAHGVQTMTQVLEQSLNTGAIYAARTVGLNAFRDYLERFGFGEKTGIELDTESAGDLSVLKKKGEIYLATASYGQGISANVLQLAAAYGALANRGVLMQPRIVETIKWSDTHEEKIPPKEVRQAVSARTAALLGGMLVSVIENGHGKKAGVSGYWVAGKTGTAQIPRQDGPGYMSDVTIGTFAGFAPVDDPKFVMVVRIDKPQGAKFAESSAAPLFGDIAKFLLGYYHIEPTRAVK